MAPNRGAPEQTGTTNPLGRRPATFIAHLLCHAHPCPSSNGLPRPLKAMQSCPNQEAVSASSSLAEQCLTMRMVEAGDSQNLWELGNRGNQLVNYRENGSLRACSLWEFPWQPIRTRDPNEIRRSRDARHNRCFHACVFICICLEVKIAASAM